jgi:hypothetical protein
MMLSFVFGVFVGFLIIRTLILLKMRRILKSIAETPVVTNKVEIDIVKLKDHYYVYKREDHSFLVHGDNKQDLIDQLHTRWPDKAFMASPNNLEEVGLK